MDDDNAWDSVRETSPLHPFEKEILKTTTLSESNESNPLLMNGKSPTNSPFTTASNDPDLFLTATQGVSQQNTTIEPSPINEDDRSQSPILYEKSRSIVNTHDHRSSLASMSKTNKQMST